MTETTSSTTTEQKPVEKSTNDSVQKSELDRVLGLLETTVKALETVKDSNKAFEDRFSKIEESIKNMTEKPKAMETPTNFPAKPKVEAEEDIGDQTKAPKDWYQSQSQQASIDQASKVPSQTDKPDLKMEEKSATPIEKTAKITTTETPRPSGISEVLNKARESGYELNPILKEFRNLGYAEGASVIARNIRSGVYHTEPHAWTPLGF